MLGEVGLSSVAGVLDAFPHQLSGGQQQRVAIAMAFACRPSLIVMDEPTTGLDATTQRTILDTVKSLRRKYGLAMIYVSHDLAVVSELANRVAVLYAGRVVESGPASEVLSNPQHPYTRGLVRAVPSAQRRIRLVAMDGIRPQIGQADAICSFEPRCAISSVKCKAEFPQMTVVGKEQHVVRCLLANTVESREAAVLRANDDGDAQIEHSAADAGQAGPVLQINNLQAYYGGHHVLRGINLSVGQNECVALVGESGSGKTTLTRCLVGLHQSWTGEMRFEREPLHPRIGQRSGASLLKMQYVFQNPYASLNPRRTIGGLIMQPLEHFTKLDRKAMERRIAETMDAVSLPKRLLNAYPDQLSGGERQRVAIARALVVRPHLLICDEITSALDVSVQASVIEMLRRLQKEQSLSLLSSRTIFRLSAASPSRCSSCKRGNSWKAVRSKMSLTRRRQIIRADLSATFRGSNGSPSPKNAAPINTRTDQACLRVTTRGSGPACRAVAIVMPRIPRSGEG
ncbi:oligopeptide/dipeptide ABC transporter ATP-binding protein (plasmid) [Mesorhizobium sp. ORM8.1]